jgi:quercetin dioxygenase-like cupin family protein
MPASLAAQDATPAASDTIAVIELAPGVTAEIFTGVPTALAPGKTLYTIRVVIQPGSELFAHIHPGTTSIGVVSGTLGWTLLEGTVYVVRGAASGAPAETEVVTEPGTVVTLNPGDALYYEDDVVHTAHGVGDEPVVFLGSLLLESGQPLLTPSDEHATPAA